MPPRPAPRSPIVACSDAATLLSAYQRHTEGVRLAIPLNADEEQHQAIWDRNGRYAEETKGPATNPTSKKISA